MAHVFSYPPSLGLISEQTKRDETHASQGSGEIAGNERLVAETRCGDEEEATEYTSTAQHFEQILTEITCAVAATL